MPAWGTYADAGNLDFYGGDLAGILQKLDYLQDLGINALYLTPIFTSPTNHRYDVQDFYDIDPHLGDEAVLARLTGALQQRGMRLIIDGVFNHISGPRSCATPSIATRIRSCSTGCSRPAARTGGASTWPT